jgi:hypothetical protein
MCLRRGTSERGYKKSGTRKIEILHELGKLMGVMFRTETFFSLLFFLFSNGHDRANGRVDILWDRGWIV